MAGVSAVNVCMVASERMCPVVQAVIKYRKSGLNLQQIIPLPQRETHDNARM